MADNDMDKNASKGSIAALKAHIASRKDDLLFALALLLISCIFFYFLLGLAGALTILGIVLFFVLPFYLILCNFNLEESERVVLSFFIGAGIFPIPVYYLGFLISFNLAMWVSFGMFLLLAALLWHFLPKKTPSSNL